MSSCSTPAVTPTGPPENGYVSDLSRGSQTVTSGGETWIEVSVLGCLLCWANAAASNTYFLESHALHGILQVGKGTAYTPTAEDVGSCLKCEVAAVDIQHNRETGSSSSPSTARVRPVPLCPQRALVPIAPPRGGNPAGKFTALTYNLLADLYASVRPAPTTCCTEDGPCVVLAATPHLCCRSNAQQSHQTLSCQAVCSKMLKLRL